MVVIKENFETASLFQYLLLSLCVDDLAVGHQSQLHKGLKTVADAQHQAVPILQQPGHLFLDGGVAEESGDDGKLSVGKSVWF